MSDASREGDLPARDASPRETPEASGERAYFAFRAAQTAVRVLPHNVVYGVARAGADLLARTRPRRFDALRSNLRHVLPEASDRELERVVRANVRNLASAWVDVMEMPYRPHQLAARLDVVRDFHHYADAVARGRGVVVVSMHFGSWETGLAAWNRGGGSLALLAERVRPERFFERLIAARNAMGVTVIPLDAKAMREGDAQTARRAGASAMREVMKTLRRGDTIAIAIDRDITGSGEMLPFFGADAPIPVGTVDVAIRAGAAVVPVALVRAGDRAHGLVFPEVVYDPAAPRDAEVRRVAGEILRLFEGLIRDHPEAWHVLEPIWR